MFLVWLKIRKFAQCLPSARANFRIATLALLLRRRLDQHREGADRDGTQGLEPGGAGAAAAVRDGVVEIPARAGAIEPFAAGEAGRADGGIAARIGFVAIEALALAGEDLGAALGGAVVGRP